MTVSTLWNQASSPSGAAADSTAYSFGVQFSVAHAGTLTAIWFYSPSGVAVLPGTIALYTITGSSLVTSQAASWSGAVGTGWIRAAFTTPPSVSPGTNYKAVVFQSLPQTWYGSTANYWSSGAGSSGITSSDGEITAPNNAGASVGQDTYHQSATLTFPDTTFNSTNYWVDPEVTYTSLVSYTEPAGAVETFAVSVNLGYSDFAAQVESLLTSIQVNLADFGAHADILFSPGGLGNFVLPAIVFVADTNPLYGV